jgi:predicted nucleotidyltransferase
MARVIEQNPGKIPEACNAHNVSSLQLFGSAARDNDFTEDSDIDLW